MFNINRKLFFICLGFTLFLVLIYSFSIFEISIVPSSTSLLKDQLKPFSSFQRSSNYSSLPPVSLTNNVSTWNDSTSATIAAQKQILIPTSEKFPLVLAYDKFFRKTFLNQEVLDELQMCEFKCEYSEKRKLYPIADVALFHSRDFHMDTSLLANNNPNRLNVFLTLEALPNDRISRKNIPKDFFNATMTFRRDSTIWIPYDKFEEIQLHEEGNDFLVWTDKQVDEMISKKNETAVIFVSHCCKTHSKRETYITEFKKHLNLSIFGECSSRTISHEKTKAEVEKHFFYFAFENSVCKDYVTEKFWRIKDLIVPVVLKRSILKGIVDDEYFIAADDFKTPKELAEKLMNLTQNLDEYKKYLGWTKKYKKTAHVGYQWSRNFCKLCEMAAKKEKHQVKDIHQWWENDEKCEHDFAFTILHFPKESYQCNATSFL